jgi:hypothetical protein
METITAEEAAKAKGCVVVYPEPDELFIDIDDAPSLVIFGKNFQRLKAAGVVKHFTQVPSPSGASDRFHITVRLVQPVADKFVRIAYQSLLGSDRIHEALSFVAALKGEERPTCFFEKAHAMKLLPPYTP